MTQPPTFAEQGIEAEFVNWRGFFAAPGLPEEQLTAYQDMAGHDDGKPPNGKPCARAWVWSISTGPATISPPSLKRRKSNWAT